MAQDNGPLSGKVEADETFIGGKIRESERRKFKAEGRSNRGPYTKPRQIVFGAVERQGRIRAEVVPSSQGYVLREKIEQFVLPGSMVFTDDWSGYDKLRGSYHHRRINHSARVYVSGDVHTNTIEGFFGLFKTGVRGTHHAISKRWLPTYLNEWVWRYNHRASDEPQFRLLLQSAARST
jgi:transposase